MQLFLLAKGGRAAILAALGPKTMTQHQIAKWCDADVIVPALAAANAATR